MNIVEQNAIDDFTSVLDAAVLADDRSFDCRLLTNVVSIGDHAIGTDLRTTRGDTSMNEERGNRTWA